MRNGETQNVCSNLQSSVCKVCVFCGLESMNVGFRFLQSKISNTVDRRRVLKADSNPYNHILLLHGTSEFMYRIPQIQLIWKQLITFCNSIVKPTTCTHVSNLFYFGITLYMFRTVFPSVIRISRLYIQRLAYVKQIQLSACKQAVSCICLTNASRCMYSLEILMTDGKTVRNMQSVIPK